MWQYVALMYDWFYIIWVWFQLIICCLFTVHKFENLIFSSSITVCAFNPLITNPLTTKRALQTNSHQEKLSINFVNIDSLKGIKRGGDTLVLKIVITGLSRATPLIIFLKLGLPLKISPSPHRMELCWLVFASSLREIKWKYNRRKMLILKKDKF